MTSLGQGSGPGLFARLCAVAPLIGHEFVRGLVVMACSMHPSGAGFPSGATKFMDRAPWRYGEKQLTASLHETDKLDDFSWN